MSYAWDNAGNPLSAAQGGSSLAYAYDSSGRLSSTTLPNGVVVAYSYDNDSRIAEIAYSSGSGPLGNLTYSYDADVRVRKGIEVGGGSAPTDLDPSVAGGP